MRAISQQDFGGPEVLTEIELPVPEPDVGEVLIRVHAAGVNPSDWAHRSRRIYLGTPPYVLGWDVSGVVERVGPGVTVHRAGDEVFGLLPYPHGVGSHAEYVRGPARAFVPKPEDIGHDEAGATPLAALTAYQALVDTAGVAPGQRVLVHGAAGGVGHLAVQIAKARGADVLGTAGAAKHDILRDLGVDEPIDYRRDDLATAAAELDVALDTVGQYAQMSLPMVRRGGAVVSIRPGRTGAFADEAVHRGVRLTEMIVESDHAGMAAVADLMRAGSLRPTIAARFPLAEAARAHELGETGRTVGKIVLTMAS